MKNNRFLVAFLWPLALTVQAQTAPPPQWYHLDPTADKTIGISTERAYKLLKTLPN